MRAPASFNDRSKDDFLTRADAEALVPVLQGRMPLLVHVERASDILVLLQLKKELPGLKMVFVGAAEGWTVAPQIAAAGVPVIATALTDLPESFEQLAASQSNVGRMTAAGVLVALGTINQDEARQARWEKQYAGIEVVEIEAGTRHLAIEAFDRFGKSRHPAALNFGDCFAYACARQARLPLLYKGDDFPLTDIEPA